jgi:hypothetical protein
VSWHPTILASKQQKVLKDLSIFATENGFYLAGGTAVALHLGHRRSVDFDWFCQSEISDPLVLARQMQEQGIPFIVKQTAEGTLHGEISKVKVSFLEYKYHVLEACLPLSKFNCNVASMQDLACMKLSAIAQRGSKKDFVDIYAIMIKKFGLSELLKLYQKKYGVTDTAHLLYGLTCFDNADKERLPTMLWNKNWRVIKDTINRKVKEFSL